MEHELETAPGAHTDAIVAHFNEPVEHESFEDLDDLRRFVGTLTEAWDRSESGGIKIRRGYALAAGPVIWSLTHHSVALARTVMVLSEQDRLVIAMPLIRLQIENMVTAIWLYLTPEGARALVHEALRNRVAAVREVVQRGAVGFTTETLEEWQGQLDKFTTDASEEGPRFERRCRSLQGGPDLYTSWRIASSLSHAGTGISDFYLVETASSKSNPLGIALNPNATLGSQEAWLGTVGSALLATLAAFERVSEGSGLTNVVANGAQRLGVTLDFHLAAAGESGESGYPV